MRRDGYCDPTPQSRIKRAHVLFTDESPVLHPVPNRQNMRTRTSDPNTVPAICRPKKSLHIMVVGGVSRYGKTPLHIVPAGQKINGQYYRDEILPVYEAVLKDRLALPQQQFMCLQQDGARPHTAQLTMRWLQEHDIPVWKDWPGNSPDLNVIEHLWNRLQESVFRQPRPQTRQQLIDRVLEEWDSITQDDITTLVESYPARIADCLSANGGHTDY